MNMWQPMETAPKNKLIWLFAATDCNDHVKPRLARWTNPAGGEEGWWEEETDCTIVDPIGWFSISLPPTPPRQKE